MRRESILRLVTCAINGLVRVCRKRSIAVADTKSPAVAVRGLNVIL
jgi:hypothetical protein